MHAGFVINSKFPLNPSRRFFFQSILHRSMPLCVAQNSEIAGIHDVKRSLHISHTGQSQHEVWTRKCPEEVRPNEVKS
eukprot:5680105-Amphidinium_carterae.1